MAAQPEEDIDEAWKNEVKKPEKDTRYQTEVSVYPLLRSCAPHIRFLMPRLPRATCDRAPRAGCHSHQRCAMRADFIAVATHARLIVECALRRLCFRPRL